MSAILICEDPVGIYEPLAKMSSNSQERVFIDTQWSNIRAE